MSCYTFIMIQANLCVCGRAVTYIMLSETCACLCMKILCMCNGHVNVCAFYSRKGRQLCKDCHSVFTYVSTQILCGLIRLNPSVIYGCQQWTAPSQNLKQTCPVITSAVLYNSARVKGDKRERENKRKRRADVIRLISCLGSI